METTTPAPKHRWTFTLRTLFVVVTLFGCWQGYHLNWIRQRRALLDEPNVTASFTPLRSAPSIGLCLLGERGANSVFLQYNGWLSGPLSKAVSKVDEAQKNRASHLFPEAKIRVWTGTVSFADDPGKPAR
jgi:hypothetical protein